MKGKIKNPVFFIGSNGRESISSGSIVNITDKIYHKYFGNRYKIKGYNHWFNEKDFEWIKEK